LDLLAVKINLSARSTIITGDHRMKVLMGLFLALIFTQTQTAYQRGDIVRVTSENSRLARIVAIPGDQVRIDDMGVYVNGSATIWISAELRSKMSRPWEPETIPAGHYFVVSEERSEVVGMVSMSRYWGLLAARNLEAVSR
jgi:signal peptidase I